MKSLRDAAGVLRSHGMEHVADELDMCRWAMSAVSEQEYRPQKAYVMQTYERLWKLAQGAPENGYLWQAVAWLQAEIIEVFGV